LFPTRFYHSLADWPDAGKALAKAREMGPDKVIQTVLDAKLRGRGGAGFPTAIKWRNIRAEACPVKFTVCNAAEGEPGTYKDRPMIRRNPYILLEGVAIAAYAIGAKAAYICMKKIFTREYDRLAAAIEEMTQAGLLGDIPIHLAMGEDAYLLGEERGLLEAIEGNYPFPRVSPPYIHGLFVPQGMFVIEGEENPTAVNNAETLSHVFNILLHGPDYFKSVGTADTPGTGIFTLLGDVERPGIYELPIGTSFRHLLEEKGGGIKGGRTFKMMLSGVSCGAMTIDKLDTALDFTPMRQIDSGLGSGGYIVFDDSWNAVDIATAYSRFLANESCGQCPSCKTGNTRITEHLERLAYGYGSKSDLAAIEQDLDLVSTGNRCFLPTAERALIRSLYFHFFDDFKACLEPRPDGPKFPPVAKILDYNEETREFVFDPKYPYKRPDGAYNTKEQGTYRYTYPPRGAVVR
jgi:NADH:ubiquinone oxidoreductase subunit F (NADH-binding)